MRSTMAVWAVGWLLAAGVALGLAAPGAGADAPALIGLGPSSAVSGEIPAAGQADRYTLGVAAGRTYVVETFDVERGTGEGAALYVYDAEGRRVARGGLGAGDADQSLELTALAGGHLEIRVVGRGSWTGRYRLRALAARGEPGAARDARGEPDGWCSIGRALQVGEGAGVDGDIAVASPDTISHHPDADSYALDLAGGSTYVVTVDGLPADAPEGAVRLAVYEEASEFMLGGGRSGAAGTPAQMIVTPRADTRYCLTIGGFGPAPWSGAYRVSAVELAERVFLPTAIR